MLIQIVLSLLDLLGVIAFGLLGALSVTGIQSQPPQGKVALILQILNIEESKLQFQIFIIAIVATSLLLIRTFVSIYLTKRALFFLSKQGAKISSNLFKGILNLPIENIKNRNSQDIVFAVNAGTNAITVGVIGSSLGIFSDAVLVAVLMLGIALLDVSVSILTLIFFGLIALILYFKMQKKARILSKLDSELAVSGNIIILEVLRSFREMKIRNRQEWYGAIFEINKQSKSRMVAELTFMPNVSKYVMEISIVFGFLFFGAIQFVLKDAVNAVGSLAIFFAAASRIAPAVLRIQQNFLTFNSSITVAHSAIAIKNEIDINIKKYNANNRNSNNTNVNEFRGEVILENVSYGYPESFNRALTGINLIVNQGEMVALVGPSGGGKTTLVDLILGLITPSTGKVILSGMDPEVALARFAGRIAYVPQDIEVMDGTIRSNICLGYELNAFSDEALTLSLEKVGLLDFVNHLTDGLDSIVGERGAKISGGQRQRLGIARALITNPDFIVLDEATSALDSETEAQVSESINNLKGSCTVLVIAHRLSTVTSADKVIYLSHGTIIASGTFSEVRDQVPNFEIQASLMGL